MADPNNIVTRTSQLTENVRTDVNAYFNNFYQPKLSIPADSDSAIQSYFEEITGDRESARLLTTAVIYTSLSQGNNPLSVLADFKKIRPGELNLYLATFLNLNRVNTSLLGVSNKPKQISLFDDQY